MSAINTHALSHSFLAQARGEPMTSHVLAEHPANIHSQDGCQSSILMLRIIILVTERRAHMANPRISAPISDHVPMDDSLTDYDRLHFVTYLRLLDAADAGIDWTEAARSTLRLDPKVAPQRAKRIYDAHMARALWMTKHGFRHLLASES